MSKRFEFNAYVHGIANGLVTITPADSHLGKQYLPAALVELTPHPTIARYAMLSIPMEMADAYAIRKPATLVETSPSRGGFAETPANRINTDGGQLARFAPKPLTPVQEETEARTALVGIGSGITPMTPIPPVSATDEQIDARVETALARLFRNANVLKPQSERLREVASDLEATVSAENK